jgi:hypothetical protein
MEPRSAKSAGNDFPYTSPTVCYIEVDQLGNVSQVTNHNIGLYERIQKGESKLYVVWPGQYHSDLFLIDDSTVYAKAQGIIPDPERSGLQEHEHQVQWQIDSSESNPRGAYVYVDVQLDCGCKIKDIRVFAEHMRRQKGWDVAVGSYPSSSQQGERPPVYTVRVKRSGLR